MRTICKKVYKIDEHPNPEAVYGWIRANWHDLIQHDVDEVICSLKALQKEVGGSLFYAISPVPDRGEYISLRGYNQQTLDALVADDCPLTGHHWDILVIEGLKKGDLSGVLSTLHSSHDAMYSDQGLKDACEANEWEFYKSGEVL